MPGCRQALQGIAAEINRNRAEIKRWVDGGWFHWLTTGGPLGRAERPGPGVEELQNELRALPRSILPLLLDAGDLAVQFNKRVDFDAPKIDDDHVEEFRRTKKVRVEIEYDSEGISLKLYHLGAPDQDRWYAPSGLQSPAFAYMFR